MNINCDFCKTKLFPTDRECPKCGAPIVLKIENNPLNNLGFEKRNIIALSIQGGDFLLKQGEMKEIYVYAIEPIFSSYVLPWNELSFSVDNDILMLSNSRQERVYARRKGESILTVSLNENPSVEVKCKVTVI